MSISTLSAKAKRDGRPTGSQSLWGAEGSKGHSLLCLKRGHKGIINMGKITELLDSITTSDENGLRQLYDVFRSIPDKELPIIRFTLYEGSSLIRQRINKKGKEVLSRIV